MAAELPLVELIALGYELCGTYSLAPNGEGAATYGLAPYTTVARISRFVEQCAGMNGVKVARRALRYVREGSGSPRETALAMLLCLPRHLGGYGMPYPVLNCRVGRVLGRGKDDMRRCDLLWPEARFAIEYESGEFHAGTAKLRADLSRRVDLEAKNIRVLAVTGRQIEDDREMAKVARVVAKALGERNEPMLSRPSEERAALRRSLGLAWSPGAPYAAIRDEVAACRRSRTQGNSA